MRRPSEINLKLLQRICNAVQTLAHCCEHGSNLCGRDSAVSKLHECSERDQISKRKTLHGRDQTVLLPAAQLALAKSNKRRTSSRE